MIRAFLFQVVSELLKARKRSLFRGLLVVLLFLAILPAAAALQGMRDPNYRAWAVEVVSFPGCLWTFLLWAQRLVLPILVAIVGAGMVGLEYASGTWKMLLPRAGMRSTLVISKGVVAFALTLFGFWISELVLIGSAFAGAKLLGVPFIPASTAGLLSLIVRAQLFFPLEFALILATAMLCTVATRSLIAGAFLAVLAEHVLRAITFLPLGFLTPTTNLDALEARMLVLSRFKADDVAAALGHHMSAAASVACVLVFTVLFTMITLWLFERRDMVNE